MKPDIRISACTYGLLLAAGAVSFTLPSDLVVSRSYAAAPGDEYQLITIVRDFQATHPDFDVLPTLGYGHDGSLVQLVLGPDERPLYNGAGTIGASGGGVVVNGHYVGNGVDARAFTGLGFSPDFIIIKADDQEPVICRTSTMTGDASKELADDASLLTNRIESLDADGFTIGSNNDVNQSGKDYYWTAFVAKPGEVAVGTYAGDGTDNRNLTGLGFDPDLVIVLPEEGRRPYHRSSAMPAGESIRFSNHSLDSNRIQGFVTDGFQVGSNDDVNKNGRPYHYVAWKAVPGDMAVGSYAGDEDGHADTGGGLDVINVGFQPTYVWVKSEESKYALHRTDAFGSADESLHFDDASNIGDGIQEFMPEGFEVGSRDEVNKNGKEFYWAAFRSNGTVMEGQDGSDEKAGGGFRVTSQWKDSASRPMAPHHAGYGVIQNFTAFQLVGQTIVPHQEFGVMVTCLGAAIGSSAYQTPITAKVRIGTAEFEPFGPYGRPVEGNLNDDQSDTGNMNPGSNPRQVVLGSTFAAHEIVSVVGQSWEKVNSGDSGLQNSHWQSKMVADSTTGGAQIIMLRDGDDVPTNAPLNNQASLEAYLSEFIDLDSGKMTMCDNQVIFLFELGMSGTDSSADFQDLVLLVTFGDHPGQLPPGAGCTLASEDICGSPIADVVGSFGAPSDGAITDEVTFDQWFADVAGVNESTGHTISMVEDASGVYEHLSPTFFPIDGELLGNEGEANNNLFTLSFVAEFTYDQCAGQFIEFEGADDAWLFIDGDLALDLGGIRPGVEQWVMMDRMNLNHGETYTVHFFYASRTIGASEFNLRTNLQLDQSAFYPSVGSAYD